MKASNAISSKAARPGPSAASARSSSPTDDRFRLTGRSLILDARVHAYRKDIADIGLAGQIFAPHYARPLARACGPRPAFVYATQAADGVPVSQLLPGEGFAVVEYAGRNAWGYCAADHIVGYVETIALAAPEAATHIVVEASAPLTASDDLAAAALATLPMGSRVAGHVHGAALATEFGFLPLSHLRPLGEHDADPAAVAERLLGAPYAEGGRSTHGIDATGLVQLALRLCGLPAPRLADQLAAFGAPVADEEAARRGDIVLFADGGGIMLDESLVIHASRAAGTVMVAALADLPGPLTIRRVKVA